MTKDWFHVCTMGWWHGDQIWTQANVLLKIESLSHTLASPNNEFLKKDWKSENSFWDQEPQLCEETKNYIALTFIVVWDSIMFATFFAKQSNCFFSPPLEAACPRGDGSCVVSSKSVSVVVSQWYRQHETTTGSFCLKEDQFHEQLLQIKKTLINNGHPLPNFLFIYWWV